MRKERSLLVSIVDEALRIVNDTIESPSFLMEHPSSQEGAETDDVVVVEPAEGTSEDDQEDPIFGAS